MKVIAPHDLSRRTDSELSALFRAVESELARTEAGTAERRAALASLENIWRERALRGRWGPP